ncbi:nicotinate-nucleotide--dimethylbenzimidazole phosphoribosyltransferase [Actinomycetospora chibensis]|uniref:Nicotinate-nucleotide--dimethylbenzimidazole phosphoribosyltransferase n=1 Tax=Actinomycetospora chibensis TaxID=663606 RepID=A0ABV9RBR8_9PSEU|nr:nicotinate-nucleotide--dimethylbenzimidazole phosphoribosyltransferase [Actinomycetospora chibensis]MDD7925500.1 nicotinate-nucleotide--dimethylbenzimidazole phosphoribosyltransferase [Actinomycetospora chibensis]
MHPVASSAPAGVAPPDETAREEARAALPGGSYGRLEELAAWLAACQGRAPARAPRRVRAVLFAADHGIAAAGVSAHAPAETVARVAAARDGSGAAARFAEAAGAGLRVVDVGLATPVPGDARDDRAVVRGGGRLDLEDVLTADQAAAALRAGREVADEEVDEGADLLVAGELAVGVSTPVAVLAAAMTGREPVAVVGRGSGIDDRAWMVKAAAVRDGLRRARPVGRDPQSLLRIAGGADLAALVGFLAQAARRRTPVVLDGAATAVAALLADTEVPGARAWWTAGTRCTEPAQAFALDVLGLEPLLDLSMRAGQGTGALTAVGLVRAAVCVG